MITPNSNQAALLSLSHLVINSLVCVVHSLVYLI